MPHKPNHNSLRDRFHQTRLLYLYTVYYCSNTYMYITEMQQQWPWDLVA